MTDAEAFAFAAAMLALALIVWGAAFFAKWLADDGYPWSGCACDPDEYLADGWDEGYQRGIRDAEQDVWHHADNPYREESA